MAEKEDVYRSKSHGKTVITADSVIQPHLYFSK
jgi:hypothetical protein